MLLLLTSFTVVWGVMVLYSWNNTEHEIEEVFDAQLAQAVNVLLELTLHEGSEEDGIDDFRDGLLSADQLHEYEHKVSFQVWKKNKLILKSRTAPSHIMATSKGYSDGYIDEKKWRFLLRKQPGVDLVVIVGEEYGVRNELIHEIMLHLLWPLIIAIPMLTFFIATSVARGLKPLQMITNEVSNRSAKQLEVISTEQVPVEVVPLVDSLNSLLRRLNVSIDAERRFTADAAHELRTPLAAIKAQAQVASRTSSNIDRDNALKMVIQGVDRSSHLIEQLLTLARLDPEAMQVKFDQVELVYLIEDAMAQIAPLAIAKNIELEFKYDDKIVIQGVAALITTMFNNLLNNAIKYTPDGGSITVAIDSAPENILISISDSGSGIPDNLKERIFDRFYRITGSSESGSGLGLSIVQKVIDIHFGKIKVFDNDPVGTKIVVELPPLSSVSTQLTTGGLGEMDTIISSKL